MKAPYLYSGIEATSYDRIDELSEFDDYSFYRLLIESNPGPVLDLGCGTGRLLLPLYEDGIDVMGLDASETMLAVCRQKLDGQAARERLHLGDMRDFEISRQFSTILIPGFSFQLLIEMTDARNCLEACLRHLEPGGQLILPTYFPWEMLESGSDKKELSVRRKSRPNKRGERVIAWQGWSIHRMDQLLTLENRFVEIDANERVLREESRMMILRWYLPFEMLKLLDETGYSEIDSYGDFQFEAPHEMSEATIFVARACR